MCYPLQLQHTKHLHPQFQVHTLLFHVGQGLKMFDSKEITFTLLIIPGIESTGSAESAGATSVCPDLQGTVGTSSSTTCDKGETMKGTEQYRNNNIEKYKTIVKALALVDAQITQNVQRRQEITKLLAQLNLEKKRVDAALDKDIMKKAYLEKEKYNLLLHFDVPTEPLSTSIPSSKLQSTYHVSSPSTPTHKASTPTIPNPCFIVPCGSKDSKCSTAKRSNPFDQLASASNAKKQLFQEKDAYLYLMNDGNDAELVAASQ